MRRPDLLAFKLLRVFVAHVIEPHDAPRASERIEELESIASHLEMAAHLIRSKLDEQRVDVAQRSDVQ